MNIKLNKKGSFINTNFNFNAGEKFHCYFREYTFDGANVRIEKSNQFSNYGMCKLPNWTVVKNETEMSEEIILDLLEKKYKNFKR